LECSGSLCWNSTLTSNEDYIYIGGLYLSVAESADGDSPVIYLVCSSGLFTMAIKKVDGEILPLRKADGFAVTDQVLLAILSGVIYSKTMHDIVKAIKNKLKTIVLHPIQFNLNNDARSISFKSIHTTSNEVFSITSDEALCKLCNVVSCSAISTVEPACPFRVRQIACGNDHCVVLANNGLVLSMGVGSHGQLGHGDLADLTVPKQVDSLSILSIVSVSAGGWHSAFLSSTGDLYMCGWNESMQLGIKNTSLCSEPEPLDLPPELSDGSMIDEVVSGVSCGHRHTVLWTERNTIFCLGGSTNLSDKRKVLLGDSFRVVTIGHKSTVYHGQSAIVCKSFDFGFAVYCQS
ncbi:hypothetical protein BOX15_Mlig000968g6, partial [Macrostomum lignano]